MGLFGKDCRCGLFGGGMSLVGGDLSFLKTSITSSLFLLSATCGSVCELSSVPAAMSLLHRHGL